MKQTLISLEDWGKARQPFSEILQRPGDCGGAAWPRVSDAFGMSDIVLDSVIRIDHFNSVVRATADLEQVGESAVINAMTAPRC